MSRKGLCLCPACGKDLAPKTIHEHTKKCELWRAKYGPPFPKFKFSRDLELYKVEAQEGIDYVQCRECLTYGWDFRFRRMMDHLTGVHGFTEASYLKTHPGATVRLASTLERRKSTVQGHYGVESVFQADSVKETSRKSLRSRFGVDHPMGSPVIRERVASTNLSRYGVTNPFASLEVQARIKETNLERYGVENPNQSDMVMEKRIRTNLARYGTEHYLETAEFQEKFEQTSRANFGTPHPMQSERGMALFNSSCIQLYGVPNPLSDPVIQAKSQATSRANHGGKHHLSDPAVIEARKKHLLELYGVDNVSKIPSVKEKIIAILRAKEECGAVPEMNGLERSVSGLMPENVIYTGNWTYWVTWVGGRRKNPDFVVLTTEQLAAYKAGVPIKDLRVHLVVEVNGDFWHTSHKGLTREKREREFIEGYKSIGATCLIIWESDLKLDPTEVKQRIKGFLTSLDRAPV
jgi:hypothetical protein